MHTTVHKADLSSLGGMSDLAAVKATIDNALSAIKKESLQQNIVITEDGQTPVMVPVRMPVQKELVTIDAVSFVAPITAYFKPTKKTFYSVLEYYFDEVEHAIFDTISDIFGENFTSVTKHDTQFQFYKYHYSVMQDDTVLAKVGFGGNQDSVYVQITGKGCYAACDDYNKNLYEFLKQHDKAHLTRLDLAFDDFDGYFGDVEDANNAESQGMFKNGKSLPKVHLIGDWKRHEGDGRTLQIGQRTSGKMMRIYEKGKELGFKHSPWLRSELEFKNKKQYLPADMLISPTAYFAGAYPYTYQLIENKFLSLKKNGSPPAKKLQTMKNESQISTDKAIQTTKRQFGKYIKAFIELFKHSPEFLDEQQKSGMTIYEYVIKLIQTDKTKDYIPKRLKVSFWCNDYEQTKSELSVAQLLGHSPIWAKKRKHYDDVDRDNPWC